MRSAPWITLARATRRERRWNSAARGARTSCSPVADRLAYLGGSTVKRCPRWFREHRFGVRWDGSPSRPCVAGLANPGGCACWAGRSIGDGSDQVHAHGGANAPEACTASQLGHSRGSGETAIGLPGRGSSRVVPDGWQRWSRGAYRAPSSLASAISSWPRSRR